MSSRVKYIYNKQAPWGTCSCLIRSVFQCSLLYPLFLQVDYTVLSDFKSTRSQDKQFLHSHEWFIYSTIANTERSLFIAETGGTSVSPFLFLAQLRFDPSPPTLLSLNSTIRDDRTQERRSSHLHCSAHPPHPALNVKLIRWELEVVFEVSSEFVLLPAVHWTSPAALHCDCVSSSGSSLKPPCP